LDAFGADDGKREQGSYMGNRCCDAVRWLLCLPKPTHDDDDDAHDHTSEARERRKRRRDAAAAAASNRDGNTTASLAASHEPL
jgi:hypothetical protein